MTSLSDRTTAGSPERAGNPPRRRRGSRVGSGIGLGAMLRLGALAAGTLALLPLQLAAMRLAPERAGALPRRFHRLACLCLGVRRRVRGTPPPPGAGVLIVANHVSWLDICVLGAERTLSFVAKSEVAGWPVIGSLADLQRTVYIDRQRRGATAGTAALMGARLAAGDDIVLFAEGTTGDGTRILPFRSSLLGAAHHAIDEAGGDVTVYPLAITYTGIQGLPGGRTGRAALAWYGDTELVPHLKHVLASGKIDVELEWGAPIAMGRATSRKDATRLVEASIRTARRQAVAGRAGG
ncbi:MULTISPECIES: lysophospholipid acyltransferase family protein [unclassified Bosea (in: a-proteobacteria)]|uniref:lysophospholipid acyltransferase family protein n=1 Tax=unclassified Bosea (in: a-proteobacteria) TaxID=2653178 RepID=UPI00095752BD|nr:MULTISPECIES: lysophospholipid acyltransferase family protein [unclassified Bosea (in: a-proteobacteria)]SIQ98410.1 lyso-ornithine lipid acyltransferase [Bosea sp. TND4EK4]